MVPAANADRSPISYAQVLRDAGFDVRHLADVTDRTWRPYREAFIAAGAEVSQAAADAVRRLLDERPVYAYVEAVAQR